jgi:hypothetical protein
LPNKEEKSVYMSNVNRRLQSAQFVELQIEKKEDRLMLKEYLEKAKEYKKRKEIKRKTTFLFEKFEAGFYDDNEFLERKKVLKKELEELDKLTLEQSSGESPRMEKAVLDFKSTLKEVLEVYHTLSNKSKKNSLLASVIDYVELTKTGKGTYDIIVVPRLKI